MKRLKKIFSWIGTFFCVCVIGIGIFVNAFPSLADTYFPYRIYAILTDSMEPIIPVKSLVVVKSLQGEEPVPGDIITFHANRFGEKIILTHYFAKTEVEDGKTYYRTHANGIETYDIYDTTYEDIKGVSVFHIPYIGSYVLFLGSPYGIGLMCLCAVISILYHYLNEHFDLDGEVHMPRMNFKRKHKVNEVLTICNIQMYDDGDYLVTKGEVWNHTSIAMRHVKGKIIFRDEAGNKVASRVFYLIGMKSLEMKECRVWNVRLKAQPHMVNVSIEIIRAKKSIESQVKRS